MCRRSCKDVRSDDRALCDVCCANQFLCFAPCAAVSLVAGFVAAGFVVVDVVAGFVAGAGFVVAAGFAVGVAAAVVFVFAVAAVVVVADLLFPLAGVARAKPEASRGGEASSVWRDDVARLSVADLSAEDLPAEDLP